MIGEVRIALPTPNPDVHPHALPGWIIRACGHTTESFYIDLVEQGKCLRCVLTRITERKARRN